MLSICVLSFLSRNLATFAQVKTSSNCPEYDIPFTVKVQTKPDFLAGVTAPLWKLRVLDHNIYSYEDPIMLGTSSSLPGTTYQESECLPYGSYLFELDEETGLNIESYALESKNYILKTANAPFFPNGEFFHRDDFWSYRKFFFTICRLDSDCLGDLCSYSFCNEFGFCETVTSCFSCGKTSATVSLKTDDSPEDTVWNIYSIRDYEIVAWNERYLEKQQIYEQIVCLETGKPYKFEISDFGIDGKFSGWYSLSFNNSTNLFEKKGDFHVAEVTTFGMCYSDDECIDTNPCSKDTCDLEKSVCVYGKNPCVDCLPGYNVTCDQDHNFCIPSSCKECGQVDFLLQVITYYKGARPLFELTEVSTNVTTSDRFFLHNNTQREKRQCLQHTSAYLLTISEGTIGYSVFVNNYLHAQVSVQKLNSPNQIFLCAEDSDCRAFDACHTAYCNQTRKQCINTSNKNFSQECRTYGSPSLLVIRVIATDRETTTAANDISNYVFGTFGKNFTMKSQMSACSYNKFNIIPFQGVTSTGAVIENGVFDIEIFLNAAGEQVGLVSNKVFEEAQKVLGDLEPQFDFVMICIPPDTLLGDSSNWKAYAFVNSYQSVYNDLACNYPSVQIHELGHNLGLSHSNDEENYGDLSGYMGASYSLIDGPRKCFNGVKSWQLGWYLDRHFVFDSSIDTYVTTYVMFGISDYADLTSKNHYNIMKIINCGDGFDYYVMFNRQDGVQLETSEGANKLLITKRTVGESYDDSFLLERLASHTMFEIILNRKEESRILSVYYEMGFENDKQFAYVQLIDYSRLCFSNRTCDDFNSCTIDLCENRNCRHIMKPCDECGDLVEVRVKTNNHPQNIIWSIRDFKREKVMLANDLYPEPYIEYNDVNCLMYGKYIFSIFYSANISLAVGEVGYSFSVGRTMMENNTISPETFYESVFVICATDDDCNDYFGCSVDVCNSETNLCDNYIDESSESCKNCTWLSINITTDNFPEETSWEFYDKTNKIIIISGEPYPFDSSVAYGRRKAPTRAGRRKAPTKAGRRKAPTRASSLASGKHISNLNYDVMDFEDDSVFEELCLPSNIIVRFSIFDSFGDGICCTEGTGSYKVTINHSVARQGGDFSDSDNLIFEIYSCIDSTQCNSDPCAVGTCDSNIGICTYSPLPCSECGALVKVSIITDADPHENRWAIFRESEQISRRDFFSTAYKLYEDSVCLSYGSYTFVVYDAKGDGLVRCDSPTVTDCGYFINVTDEVIAAGNLDSFYEERFFIGICKEDKNCDDSDPCTLDRCDVANQICIFDEIPCIDCNMSSLEVIVNTDGVPFETSWELVNENSKQLELYQGPYYRKYFQYSRGKCLKEGSYTFNIFDGNGLCTEEYLNISSTSYDDVYYDDHDDYLVGYSCGDYSIIVNNEIIHEGGSFTGQETINFEILQPTSFSLIPKSPFNEWYLNFEQASKYASNNTEIILLEYRMSKEKSIEQISAKILDYSCSDIIKSGVVTMEKKELIVLEDDVNDSLSISVRLNKTSLRETSVWKNISHSRGSISFCVRIDLSLEDISVSFEETKIIIITNLLASTFEVENINVEKHETSIAGQVAKFEVSSCLCDGSNICLYKATVTQNSLIRICVFPANEMLVESFVNVILYQDRIPKLIAIEQEKLNKLVRVTGGTVGVFETRVISAFFDEPSPSPLILKGDVALSLVGHRSLTITEKEYYKQVSFESEIRIKKRLVGKVSMAIFLILATAFVTIGIKFYFHSPYLALRTEEF